jgi:hypothetical protein
MYLLQIVKHTFGLNDKGVCKPNLGTVCGWVATVMQVDAIDLVPLIDNCVCFNPIRMYTLLAKIAKKRLPGASYSTEMPLEHAYIYAKNLNSITKPLGMLGCGLEDCVLALVGTAADTWVLDTVIVKKKQAFVIKTMDNFYTYASSLK